jgi:hypothetical protein
VRDFELNTPRNTGIPSNTVCSPFFFSLPAGDSLESSASTAYKYIFTYMKVVNMTAF